VHDPDAFRVLYDRYAERMFRYFIRRTGNHDASLDLTAETFARAWFGVAAFRDLAGGSAGPWLFGIARNVLFASVAAGRLESEARTKLGLLMDRNTEEPETDARWLTDVDQAVAALPSQQREAIELRVMADLSYEETAAALGCSPTAARIRVSRALSALRSAIEGGGAQ